MNQKYLHYASLFVSDELQKIESSIETETNEAAKVHLIRRKNELENDLKDIEQLKE